MEVKGIDAGHNCYKRLVVLFVFLVSAARLFSLDVFLELSDTRIKRGSTLVLDLFIERIEGINPDVIEPTFPDIIKKTSGPYISPVKKDVNGETKPFWRYRYKFIGIKSGRRVIKPFFITSEAIETKTEPVLIEVSYISDINKVSFDVEWVFPEKVYKGESFPLVLCVKNMDKLIFPSRVSIGEFKGAFVETSAFFSDAIENKYRDFSLYDIPVRSFVLTAFDNITLPPADITIGDVTEAIEDASITVVDIPWAVDTGAIGDFDFYYDWDLTSIDMSMSFTLRMTISGDGNLPYLSFPEILLDNMIIAKEWEDSDISTGLKGYKGWRTKTLVLKPLTSGRLRLDLPEFVYFSPTQNSLERIRGKSLVINVKPAPDNKTVADILGSKKIISIDQQIYLEKLFFFISIAGIVGAIFLLLFKKTWISLAIVVLGVGISLISLKPITHDINSIDKAYSLFKNGKYKESLELYTKLSKDQSSPAFFYNMAALSYKEDKIGDAVFFLKKALLLYPNFIEAKNLLYNIAEERDIRPGKDFFIPYDLMTVAILLIVSVYMFYIFSFLFLFFKKRLYLVAMLTFSVFVFIFAFFTIFTQFMYVGKDYAVVLKPSIVYNVPREAAKQIYKLTEGTEVLIRYKHKGFFLVKNDYGIEGWVYQDLVKRLK